MATKKIDTDVYKKRLDDVRRYLNVTYAMMSTKSGISLQTIRQISCGYMKISAKTAMRLAAAYPEISAGWLSTGNGNMIVSRSQNEHEIVQVNVDYKEKYLALMEESLAAQKQILFLKEKILDLEKQLSEAK